MTDNEKEKISEICVKKSQKAKKLPVLDILKN
jgi:hypothetical protein